MDRTEACRPAGWFAVSEISFHNPFLVRDFACEYASYLFHTRLVEQVIGPRVTEGT
jgi:hypothetical protein